MTEKTTEYNVITQGSLHKAMWKLAIPAMLSMVMITFFQIADAYWISSSLPTEAVAGFGGASFVYWFFGSILEMLGIGTVALIAQSKGAKDDASHAHWSSISVSLAFSYGLIIAGIFYLTAPLAFDFMNLSPVANQNALDYITIIVLSAPLITFTMAGDSIFRGSGDTLRPMIVSLIAVAINAVLDPFLINGWWIFPKMELQGAALSTLIAQAFAMGMIYFLLFKRKYKFKRKKEQSLLKSYWQLMKIGVPIAALWSGFSLIYFFLSRIINSFGDSAMAAVTIGHRIEGIAYFMTEGFAMAVATLVGQNVGAKKFDRAKNAVRLSISYCNWMLALFCLLFFFAGPKIYELFEASASVVDKGAAYLMIIAIFDIFMGWEIIYSSAFGGAGNTYPPFLIGLPLTALRIPLAYFFAYQLNLGLNGIWWAIGLSTMLKGICLSFWWSRNNWIKKAKVMAQKISLKMVEADPTFETIGKSQISGRMIVQDKDS